MNEKVKGYLEKAKTTLGKVSKKIWIIAAVVLVVLAAGIAIFLNNKPYAMLITSNNQEEIAAVMNWLEEQGYQDYRMDGGNTILVPSGQEVNLKGRLLMEGYPKQGYSYSTYYDNVSSLSTEAERNQAYLLLIQDRVGAVIESLNGVSSAVVSIDQSDSRGSVLSGGNQVSATASVRVTMEPGETLSNQMAAAIRNYLAHAVEGLEMSNIAVIDNYGNIYNDSTLGDATNGDAYALKLQLEEQIANRIQAKVMQILIPFYGEENVRAVANVTVEMSSTTIDDYQVHLPDWANDGSTGGRGIIGSLIYDHDFSSAGENPAGGVVGTEANSDYGQYVEDLMGDIENGNDFHVSGEREFDNSKTQTHTERPIGYVSDCTVSVSINSTTAGAVDIDAITKHAANAAQITAVATEEMTAEEYLASKVSVVTGPFYSPTEPGGPDGEGDQPGTVGGVPLWIIIAAAVGILLFVVVLVVILLLRKKKKKKQQELEEQQNASVEELLEAAGIPLEEGEEPVTGADVMDIQTERSMELRKDIRQFVDENPEIAATMIKNWLKGDDDNG